MPRAAFASRWRPSSETSAEESIVALLADRTRPSGFTKPRVIAWGSAPSFADVDRDGLVDLVALDRNGGPAISLYRQDPPRAHRHGRRR
jgi:hypothetical protein